MQKTWLIPNLMFEEKVEDESTKGDLKHLVNDTAVLMLLGTAVLFYDPKNEKAADTKKQKHLIFVTKSKVCH